MRETPFLVIIQGIIRYRERISLAPNFVCLVRLVDLSAKGGPVEVDRDIIRGPLHIPLPYTLQMDGYRVNITHEYVVEAFIFAPDKPEAPDPGAGIALFRSIAPVPVLTKGRPARVDIPLTMRPASAED